MTRVYHVEAKKIRPKPVNPKNTKQRYKVCAYGYGVTITLVAGGKEPDKKKEKTK